MWHPNEAASIKINLHCSKPILNEGPSKCFFISLSKMLLVIWNFTITYSNATPIFFCNIVKEFNKDWMSRKLIIHGKEMTRNIWRWQILFWVCQHSKQSIQNFLFPFYIQQISIRKKKLSRYFFMYFLRTFDHRKKVCLSISRLFFYFKQTTSSKSKAYTFFHFLHTSCRQNIMHGNKGGAGTKAIGFDSEKWSY